MATTHGSSFTYDRDGRRLTMVDGTGTSTYAYDAAGRLTTSKNGANAVTGYAYDAAGNLTVITYPVA